MNNDDRPNVLLDRSIWGPLFPSLLLQDEIRKREAIGEMVRPPGFVAVEQFDLSTYDFAPLSSLPAATWRQIFPGDAVRPRNLDELLDLTNCAAQDVEDEIRMMVETLTSARDEARSEVARLTALLAERDAPQPEPSLTPDGALAPIPRDSALGNTLAALRAAENRGN